MKNYKCENCKYWEPEVDSDEGECLRYPPAEVLAYIEKMPNTFIAVTSMRFPTTNKNNKCGEFKKNDNPKTDI